MCLFLRCIIRVCAGFIDGWIIYIILQSILFNLDISHLGGDVIEVLVNFVVNAVNLCTYFFALIITCYD